MLEYFVLMYFCLGDFIFYCSLIKPYVTMIITTHNYNNYHSIIIIIKLIMREKLKIKKIKIEIITI